MSVATEHLTPGVGDRLLAFLREVQAVPTWRVTTEPAGAGSNWRIGGATWDAAVTVDRTRWLGLQFVAVDPHNGGRTTYEIDTDLYDITQPGQRDFADTIERDIIEFIANLRDALVLRGNIGSKFVLVFPRDGAYIRVVAGRLSTTVSTHAGQAAAQAGGEFVSVA